MNWSHGPETYIQCKASFAKGIPNKWRYLQPVLCWDILVIETFQSCLPVVLKLTTAVFISLYFQTFSLGVSFSCSLLFCSSDLKMLQCSSDQKLFYAFFLHLLILYCVSFCNCHKFISHFQVLAIKEPCVNLDA